MRIDLSREEETRMLPSDSDVIVSFNAFQKELVELHHLMHLGHY